MILFTALQPIFSRRSFSWKLIRLYFFMFCDHCFVFYSGFHSNSQIVFHHVCSFCITGNRWFNFICYSFQKLYSIYTDPLKIFVFVHFLCLSNFMLIVLTLKYGPCLVLVEVLLLLVVSAIDIWPCSFYRVDLKEQDSSFQSSSQVPLELKIRIINIFGNALGTKLFHSVAVL